MGADLCLVALEMGVDKSEALDRLERADIELLRDVLEYVMADSPEDDADVRSTFEDALISVYRWAETNTRGVVSMTLRDVEYLFCGGSSWGDSPCDEWDACSLIEYLGITMAEWSEVVES